MPVALFLGAAGILAGVDLLAKFYSGEDITRPGEVGKRFRNYILKHFDGLSEENAIVIWQFRNSLLHSYGLYGKDQKKEYHFIPAWASGKLVQAQPENLYWIACVTLWRQFEKSIGKYRTALSADNSLKDNFHRMFPKYGSVYLGSFEAKEA